MKITGKYFEDDNFIMVYTENALYSIARKTGDWGRVAVGQWPAVGPKLTQERLDELRAQCPTEGAFELEEG